jgi:membrane protein YqaA with SNARE-associated domain
MLLLGAFLIGVVVDSIPVFAPPAWSILIVLIVKWKADPWGVIFFGVIGSTLGRYFLSLYIRKVTASFLNLAENQNLEYVGNKLARGFWPTNLFVLLYTLTPLSTTTLFTAAAMGRVNVFFILPAFALGKFVSDAFMIFTARSAAGDITDFFHGAASAKSIVGAVLALALVGGLLFVDWQTLIEERKLKFRFRIWKTAKRLTNGLEP